MSLPPLPSHITGKFILLAKLHFREEKFARAKELVEKVRAWSTSNEEPGTLTYRTSTSAKGDPTILVFEEYASPAALEFHGAKSAGGFKVLTEAHEKEGLFSKPPDVDYWEELP